MLTESIPSPQSTRSGSPSRNRIAAAIAEEIGREVGYRPVETDGAARAAAAIGELL